MASAIRAKKKLRPCARLGVSVRKKIPSIRTASAIRAKNNVIRPNGSSYPFKTVADFKWAVCDLVARAGITQQTCQKCK